MSADARRLASDMATHALGAVDGGTGRVRGSREIKAEAPYATALTARSASASFDNSANTAATAAVCSIVGAPSPIHRLSQRNAQASYSWGSRQCVR
jgi:hypothetical protein